MDQKDNSEDLTKRVAMQPEDAAQARKIYQSIIDDSRKAFAAQTNERERTKTAEWAAICKEHATIIDHLKALIDANMNEKVLAELWKCNQGFLKQLTEFEATAQELDGQGRPQLHESLKAWKHDTDATNLMVQYVLNSRHAAQTATVNTATATNTAPVAQPAAAFDKQALLGIWDITLADGRRVELALDDHTFSYVQFEGTFAYWGEWTFYANAGGHPLMSLTRKGGYPAKYYGPLGTSDLIYSENEAWGITAAQGDRVSFGNNVFMVRRKGVQLPFVTARISDVQAQFRLADMRDKDNATQFINQRNAVASAQGAMWDYINSGAGRYRSGR